MGTSEITQRLYMGHLKDKAESIEEEELAEDDSKEAAKNKVSKAVNNADRLKRSLAKFPPLPLQTKKELEDYGKTLVSALTLKQRKFCDAYVAGPTIGNATQSAKAAGYQSENKLDNIGYENLNNTKVLRYIEYLIFVSGLNPASVDAHLLFLVQQTSNMKVKLDAIKEFNRLHSRISSKLEIQGEINHTSRDVDLAVLDDDELETFLELYAKVTNAEEIEEAEIVE